MANKGGIITRKDIISEDAMNFGKDYAEQLKVAIEQNIALVNSVKELNALATKFKKAENQKAYIEAKQAKVLETQKAINNIKKREAAELSLLKVKKQSILTAEAERKAKVAATNAEKIAQTAKEKTIKLTAQERYEIQQLNKMAKQAAILSSSLSTEYEKQSVKLIQLRRRYKDVALTQGYTSTEAKKLRAQIQKLDTTLKQVDAHVGQYQRSVGNYGKAMQSASAAARTMMSAMGVAGGAYLFVSVMRDAFTRVRDFDKSMQNLAGVFRTTREELAPLETDIISIAGASIKTSREVADLAENLATLGKSPEQIQKLLKPVIDLGIGLETTGEEAGEFLVQMLNAFGASDDEALKYADTIATIRTSTTLDFQKMRDSFQYIAPISKILNKDLAYTGAVVGILADNSLKAESAGRLLSTAQQRLSKSGKSLTDALDEINEAKARGVKEVDLLKIANDLFGAQAAKVGVILADNTDKIETNAQAIRDNGGALDDLVNEQLKSLDAKILLLDSNWEKLIFSIENGNGSISDFAKTSIDGLSGLLDYLARTEQASDRVFNATGVKKGFMDYAKHMIFYLKGITTEYDELSDKQIELDKLSEDLDGQKVVAYTDSISLLNNELLTNKDLSENMKELYKQQIKRLEDVVAGKLKEKKVIKEVVEEVEVETEAERKLRLEKEKTNKAYEARLILLKNDEFSFNKSQLESEIALNKTVLESEEKTLTEKQIANIRYYEAKKQLLDISKDYEVSENKGRTDKLAEIELKYNDDLNAIQEERKTNGISLLKSQFDEELKTIKEAEQAKTDAMNSEIGVAQSTLSSSSQSTADVETYEAEVAAIKKKYALITVQAQIDAVKKLQGEKGFSVEQQAELSKQLSDLEITYSNISTDQILENNEKQIEAEEEKAQRLAEIRQRAFSNLTDGLADALDIDGSGLTDFFASLEDQFTGVSEGITGTLQTISAAATVARDIIGSVYDANIEELEAQLDASNDYYDNAYDRAEGDQVQQDLIREEQQLKEDELNKKIAKEKTKQAKADKAAALVQAGINTALAVTAALATQPFLPLGPIMATLAGVLGAVQIGIIASKPIPKYKHGRMGGKAEFAEVGDGYVPEVIEKVDGSAYLTPAKPTLAYLEEGDKVHSSVDDYYALQRAAMLSSINMQGKKLNNYQAKAEFNKNLNQINQMNIEDAITKGFKKQKVHFHTTTNTKVDMNYPVWRLKNLYRN